MRLPLVEDWSEEYPDESDAITSALKAFHQTTPFTQTWEEFKIDPHAYINNRIGALNQLLDVLENEPAKPHIELLKKRAILKKEYLTKLPDPLTKYTVKEELFGIRRSIPMRNFFWFEKLDPLHRFGNESFHYLAEWNASSVPNFFIFLETLDYHRRNRSFAPFKNYIIYYTAAERALHEVQFQDHSILLQGNPVHSKTLPNNEKIPLLYILGNDGKLYINDHLMFRQHHSSEFCGENILGVGEIVATEGKIELLTNSSGHYKPSPKDIFPTLELLRDNYGDLSEVRLQLIYGDFHACVRYNAQEFLDTRGECAALEAKDTWTPLHHAIQLQQWTIAESLLPKYKDTLTDPKFCDPWKLVYDSKDLLGYKFLLDAGIDPFPANSHSNPFMWAARDGDIVLFEFLLGHLSEVRQHEVLTHECLFNTASGNSYEMIDYLVQRNLDFSRRTQLHQNIMHFAAVGGIGMVRYFEQNGFGYLLYEQDAYNMTPLLMAAMHGSFSTVEYLMSKGHGLNVVDYYGNTPLHLAIENGNITNARWLLTRPEGITFANHKNSFGQTPLHSAISVLPPVEFKKLLTLMDNVDVKDEKGLTPYGYMAANAQFSINARANAILLLENGANIQEPDANGIKPWQHLVLQKQTDFLVHLLVHFKGDVRKLLEEIKLYAKEQDIKIRL
jgi:ankyrin repeat protein